MNEITPEEMPGLIKVLHRNANHMQEWLDEKDTRIAELEKENGELEASVKWWGNLVRREDVGSEKTPSLKAYIEQLEEVERLAVAYRDACYTNPNTLQQMDTNAALFAALPQPKDTK